MNKIQKFTITAALALALALTFSCSSDSDSDKGSGNGGDPKLVGKWYVTQESANSESEISLAYNFASNGDLTIASTVYTWSAKGGKITTYYSGYEAGTADYTISGTKLDISNDEYSGLSEGTFYKPSSGNDKDDKDNSNDDKDKASHPIVGTSWSARNYLPSPHNLETIGFRENGMGSYYYHTEPTTNPYYYPMVNESFTYTISGNTITMSVAYKGVKTFTYSGGNTLTLAGLTFTKIN